jgi:hypothetical protein
VKSWVRPAVLMAVAVLFLSGCSRFQPEPEIKVVTQTVKVTVPIATRPKPIDLVDTRVYVVNEANLEKFIEDFKAENGDLAFVALSVKDYENLALNVAELRRFINQQKEIIIYYEEAMKPDELQPQSTTD